MKSETYPLALPPDLLGEARQTAKAAGLSLADAMRQSLKLGLPKLREQLAAQALKPFTSAEAGVCQVGPAISRKSIDLTLWRSHSKK
jgi:hypothetical protein